MPLFALLLQHFPSASAFLSYFSAISVFLFLNHFPFLLKSIKIAVLITPSIFTSGNAITAIVFSVILFTKSDTFCQLTSLFLLVKNCRACRPTFFPTSESVYADTI